MEILGLKTCDTTRAAVRALAARGGRLRDLREAPLSPAEAAEMVALFGPGAINRASTTWRSLDAAEQGRDPVALLTDHPALLKRPVIRAGGRATQGWAPAIRAIWLGE
jgi:arsenate reductase-like glutaredoxin family protein